MYQTSGLSHNSRAEMRFLRPIAGRRRINFFRNHTITKETGDVCDIIDKRVKY